VKDETATIECPNCLGISFTDEDRCARCGRPRHEPTEYLEAIENLAHEVVSRACEEIDRFSVGECASEDLRGAIARLGARLRAYHYEGDGCLDH
jgi:hypothetical protein